MGSVQIGCQSVLYVGEWNKRGVCVHNSAYTPFYGFMLYDIVISQHGTKIGDKGGVNWFLTTAPTAFRQQQPKIYQISSVFLRLV